MYYVLVNNEIHNLLQFTIHVLLTQNSHLYTYLTPNLHFSIQKRIVQVLKKPFLSTGKVLRFYTGSNTAVSGNSMVDLNIFIQKWGIFH